MPLFSDYSCYIFDCDGVILDSNTLKVRAMESSLLSMDIDREIVTRCINYFSENFGKSRFHHISYFKSNFVNSTEESFEKNLLIKFSDQCKKLYLKASYTPDFIRLLDSLSGEKYIASGSEQGELREVLTLRNVAKKFNGVYGSPTPKGELIRNIISCPHDTVMIGNAASDFEAARINNIDFIYYSPFSLVDSKMRILAGEFGFRIVDNFVDLIYEK